MTPVWIAVTVRLLKVMSCLVGLWGVSFSTGLATTPRFYLPFEDALPPTMPTHFDSAVDGLKAEATPSGLGISQQSPALAGDPGSCTFLVMEEIPEGKLSVPYRPDFNGDSFTVSFWMRLRPSTGWGTPYHSFLIETYNNFWGHGVFLGSNRALNFMTGNTPGIGDGRDHLYTPGTLDLNQFYHIAFTFERTSVVSSTLVRGTKTIYVNGASVASKANAPYRPIARATHLVGMKDLVIGDQKFFQSPRPYTSNLDMDEFRIYDFAQTQAQVQQDYQARHPCPEQPPVLSLPFEDVFAGENTNGFRSAVGGHIATPNSSGVTVADAAPARAGRPGSCEYVSFNSAQRGSINVPYSDDFNRDSFTVSFWVKLGSNSQVWRGLYNSASGSGANYQGHALFLLMTNTLYFATARRATDPQQVWDYLTFTISGANQFQHITVTFEKTASLAPDIVFGTKKLYINGALVSTKHNAEYRPQTHAATKMPFSFGNRYLNHSVYPTNGDFDELKIYDYAQTAAQVQRNYIATHACREKPPQVHMNFEQSAAGSLPNKFDSSVGTYSAQLSGSGVSVLDSNRMLSGNPGSCEYLGLNDAARGRVSIPYTDALNGDSFSVSFWYRPKNNNTVKFVYSNLKSQNGSDHRGHGVNVNGSGGLRFFTGSDSATWDILEGPALANNQAYYLTFSFEKTSILNATTVLGKKKIYVNGMLEASRSGAKYQPLRLANLKNPFILGSVNFKGHDFAIDAEFDELKIYDYAISQNLVRQNMQERHGCPDWPQVDHLKISHDGSGVFYCPETLNISARKSDATIVTGYTETIQLSTNNNLGAWQKSATNSLGTLTPSGLNDGRASYTFVPADNGNIDLRLVLPHGAGPTQVDITDGTVSDDNSHGALSLASLGFEVDKVPGAGFGIVKAGENQTIELRAYNSNTTLNSCTLATNYAGPKTLQIRMDALNPTRFQVAATVTPSGGRRVNLPTAASGYANVPLAFHNGIAQLTLNYPDVGKLRLQARDAANTSMRGTSIDFVSRPYRMQLTVTNPDDPNAGDDVFAVAGEPFTVRFQAFAKGDIPTRNFGRETPPVQMGASAVHAWPSGGSVGTLSGNYRIDNGSFLSSDASYSEVGRLHFRAHMVWNGSNNHYLGVPVDYTSDGVSRSVASNLGRFIPERFDYVELAKGQWLGGCLGKSYLGEPLRLSNDAKMRLTAVNRQGLKTQNYVFGSTPYTQALTLAAADVGTRNADGSALNLANPNLSSSADTGIRGEMTLSLNAAFQYQMLSGNRQDLPPFQVNVPIHLNSFRDSDGVSLLAAQTLTPNGLDVMRGRIRLRSGSTQSIHSFNLPVLLEHFDGNVFVPSLQDSCSQINGLTVVDIDANDGFDFIAGSPGWGAGVTPPLTAARQYQLADAAILKYVLPPLAAATDSGTVKVTADVPMHLRYGWQASAALENPSAWVQYGSVPSTGQTENGGIVVFQEMF